MLPFCFHLVAKPTALRAAIHPHLFLPLLETDGKWVIAHHVANAAGKNHTGRLSHYTFPASSTAE